MIKKIEISHKTIIFTVFFLLFLYFLYFIRNIILQLFLALLLTTILDPVVKYMFRRKIPKILSILVAYVLFLGLLSFVIATITPTLFEQTSQFVNRFPTFVEDLGFSSVINEKIVNQLITQAASLPSQLAKITISVFSNIISIVTILVLAFYLLSERDKFDDAVENFFGMKKGQEIERFVDSVERKMGGWARAEFLLMFVVGLCNYIGFLLLGIPFALPLAILAGLLEIVPYLGPILAAIPAILIAFGMSLFTGIAAVALAFLIQQLENYLLVPKIMQKSTGVSPIVTLLALSIGFEIAGIPGLLVSVPVYILIQIAVSHYFSAKNL